MLTLILFESLIMNAPIFNLMSDSDLSSLRKLIQKVGSEIPEIRLRSINNIFNKLENGLL